MTRRDKDLRRILDTRNDSNIDFDLLVTVLTRLGFTRRIVGSHHIYSHPSVARALSLQPERKLAKSYQVRQVRSAILESTLLEPDE